jgi:hypothetical protein
MDVSVASVRHTGSAVDFPIRFFVEPGSETVDAGAVGETFLNREVFGVRPNWATDITLTHTAYVETVDYGQGRTARFTPRPFNGRTIQATFLGRTPDEVAKIEGLFERSKGQQGEFRLPTEIVDLVPLSGTTQAITIAGRDFADAYAGSTIFTAVEILLASGATFRSIISSIAVVGSNSVIALRSAAPIVLTAANVVRASWLPLVRFASDSLTTEWVTGTVAQVQITFMVLEDLTPETY